MSLFVLDNLETCLYGFYLEKVKQVADQELEQLINSPIPKDFNPWAVLEQIIESGVEVSIGKTLIEGTEWTAMELC